MNKFLSSLIITPVPCAVLLLVTNLHAQTPTSSSKPAPVEAYTIAPVPAENGFYTISSKIGEDGKVAAGTVLRAKAKPASGYTLDAVYYTVKGGIWGTTS